MKSIIINGNKMMTKQRALEYISRKLEFEDYYCKNIYALWDFLTNTKEEKHIIIVNEQEIYEHLEAYGHKLINIFFEAAKKNSCLTITIAVDKDWNNNKITSCIVAISKNHVIGNNGIIPWSIKGEQKRFKELTTGKTIIMGRKSFEEIGSPLPNRRTILISNTVNIKEENCHTVSSLMEAFEMTKEEDEVFIAGGASVYKEAMNFIDRIYLTVIDMEVEGDCFFPLIDENKYRIVYIEKVMGEVPYTYYTYDKINPNMRIDKTTK